jgi:hypothetical protein
LVSSVDVFNSKQKRSFQTLMSGFKLSKYGNKTIRFLTLTTSLLCSEQLNYENGSLNSDFQILRKRIMRYSPYRLYKEGYITKNNMTKKYGRNDLTKTFNFDYFKVETNEGNGVLHITYRGSWLPYNFLVDNWTDIHNSWDINIQKINLDDCKNASSYIVSQYVGGQGSSYVRSSQSWNWVYRGFKSKWYSLKSWFSGQKLFSIWDNILKQYAMDYFYPQTSLADFG